MNFILNNENAIYYECGYSSDNSIYLSLGSDNFFLTDSRYQEEAKNSIKNASIIIDMDINKKAIEIINSTKIKEITIDSKEWSIYNFKQFQEKTKITFKEEVDFSKKKRIIKSKNEIEILNKAVKVGKEGFKRFAKEILTNGFGKDEFRLTYDAKSSLSNYGEFELSFDPIVAINKNASRPHATPTKTILKEEDLLLVDAGVKYNRYCSDRTRTVFINKNFEFSTNPKFKNSKIQKAYDIVLKAHNKAIEGAKSGMVGKDIDKIARDIIENSEFRDYFIHSTGHGVGLDIHELPNISKKSDTLIEDGMVFTIEPGIYIPNEFGIRIEDMVFMQNGKAVVL